MNLRQAAQQALEASDALKRGRGPFDEKGVATVPFFYLRELGAAMEQLRAAVAEPVQNEPLAWFRLDEKTNEAFLVYFPSADGKDWRPLYAMPRKPLSEDEIVDIWAGVSMDYDDEINIIELARAIERAHGIGELK